VLDNAVPGRVDVSRAVKAKRAARTRFAVSADGLAGVTLDQNRCGVVLRPGRDCCSRPWLVAAAAHPGRAYIDEAADEAPETRFGPPRGQPVVREDLLGRVGARSSPSTRATTSSDPTRQHASGGRDPARRGRVGHPRSPRWRSGACGLGYNPSGGRPCRTCSERGRVISGYEGSKTTPGLVTGATFRACSRNLKEARAEPARGSP